MMTTVAELNKKLFEKLHNNVVRGEQHRLYLAEGGRGMFFIDASFVRCLTSCIERILGPTERPATIVKRRLMLNGYEPEDGLELLGIEDQPYLFRFSYKSQLLGPPVSLTIPY